jgi:mannan endo-1,4-beta-mannosidase
MLQKSFLSNALKFFLLVFASSLLITSCKKEAQSNVAAPARVPIEEGIFGNGVNLQPSYYNNGNVNFGWSLMKQNTNIRTVRIEIEPDKVSQAKNWISQARSNGYAVIATYHKASVLGSDASSELTAAANWWKSNYSNLASAGSFTINLMNEWGSHNISSNAYASAYNTAISIVRQVYSGRIIIDIPGWGQETRTAADAVKGTNGTRINDGNIVLSAHIYPGAWNQGRNRTLINADLDELGSAGRSCMLGEFGTGSGSANWSGLVNYAKSKGWTVLAWAWNGDGGSLNMVTPSWASNSTATSFSKSSYFNTVYSKL